MKNITGFLIRQGRLAQNLSQEGLCKGICAVSYLSKIEQGQVEPGKEIIDHLFSALGITFEQDEAFEEHYRQVLYGFFDAFVNWETAQLEAYVQQLEAAADRLEHSTLYIDYKLFVIYQVMRMQDTARAMEMLHDIGAFVAYMDRDTEFIYWLAHYYLPVGDEAALAAIIRAKALYPCSLSYYAHANFLYKRGHVQEALREVTEGFRYAVEEGTIKYLREFSLLEGNCYANLFNHELMLQAYRRALALHRGDKTVRSMIQYNIGATLLEVRRYEEALPYLLEGYEGATGEKLYVCHKLALVYDLLGDRGKGRRYLEEAKQLASGKPDIFRQMIRVVALRYEGDYLESEEYLQVLKDVYDHIMPYTGFGFKQFHGLFLIDAYTHRRKYKEALGVAKEINWPVSLK